MRSLSGVSVALLLVVIASSPARAQTSRIGPSMTAISDVVRGSSVAYDYKDSIYFVVSAHGNLNGRLISADGALLGAVQIQPSSAGFNQYPGVAYSPDAFGGAGGFLVSWHQSLAVGAVVHARMVSTSGALGPESRSRPTDRGGKPVRISPIRPQARNSSSSGRHRVFARSGSGMAAKCSAPIST